MHITRPLSRQPMPDNAQKVFSGVMFDVYQWEVEDYVGGKRVFEKITRPDTVIVIAVTREKKILVAHQEQPGKKPFMGLLGGRVDDGEDPFTAVKRELLEESGYISSDWELYFGIQPVSKIDWAVYVFVARDCMKIAEKELDGAEKIEVMEVGFDEFLEMASRGEVDMELQCEVFKAKLDAGKMAELRRRLGV